MGSEHWTPELCDYCKTKALIPGIIFPIASDGFTDHAYVECCDECKIFVNDDTAAVVMSIYLEQPLGYAGMRSRPYIVGMTFEEADKLKLSATASRSQMKGVQLTRGDHVLWLDEYGFSHVGVVMEHLEPFVLVRGGRWTRIESITIWVKAINQKMDPMLALHHQVKACPHPKRGKAVMHNAGDLVISNRYFCKRCGKTL